VSKTPVFDQTVEASDPDIWKASPVFPEPTSWRLVAVAEDPQPNPGFFRLAWMLMKEMVRR
jgi:hypothetical protein